MLIHRIDDDGINGSSSSDNDVVVQTHGCEIHTIMVVLKTFKMKKHTLKLAFG